MIPKSGHWSETYAVRPGTRFSLKRCNPRAPGGFASREQARSQAAADAEAIDRLQDRLYAEGRHALLVVLQGIDCSGKDGTVRAVFNSCGPIGVRIAAFKAPTPDELAHDFLWRVHRACPPKGFIGIFNRSHYEDVLVAKVRQLASPKTIEQRYDQINAFEALLSASGTRILKFMLNISKQEQAERLRERIATPEKRWKFNPADLEDRKLWNDYMRAYEIAIRRCSTQHAPWHVIPADHNWVRNAIIARIVRETLEEMDPQYPKPKDWNPAKIRVV
ncbi:polyphosphate kinase 2 family protein [Aestuariivirga sp.]|jgi:PPK2 family polyphosphate:nucleotide phosphotransferase|uniref:polyphosphate kinase 2 family protein n=1 Tax=Aestuariivirga sp. TaxID=2650926 RepID=UPI0037841823